MNKRKRPWNKRMTAEERAAEEARLADAFAEGDMRNAEIRWNALVDVLVELGAQLAANNNRDITPEGIAKADQTERHADPATASDNQGVDGGHHWAVPTPA